jgi:chromosome segregation ATPase
LEEKYLEMEQENQFVGVENTDDGLLWQMDNRSYDELLKKFIENEEVLRVSNFKLQLSEQEIIKLKIQIDERENQLGNVREELKLKEEELRKKTAESETQIPHYVNKVANMAEKLGVANEQLKRAKDEIAILRKELDSKSYKTRELQDQLKATKENLAKLECAKYFRGEIILKC